MSNGETTPTREFEEFRRLVEANRNFVLTTHVNPDGDGIGSECALAAFLQGNGKQASILNHSSTPDNYRFLCRDIEVRQFNQATDTKTILDSDVIVVLDTNHPDRLGSMKDAVLQSKAIKVCIDHHLDPAAFADLYILDDLSTATGEILYRLFINADRTSIDKTIAISIYTAIMTDTGSFKYPKTDPEVHRIIAHLIEAGADPVEIYQQVYEQGPSNRLKLLGEALAQLQLAADERIAYLTITREMMHRTGTSEVDTDAFVPYTLSVRGVQIGLMFTELDGFIKISLRSKGDIWINELAKEFGGNGHKNAAGARIANTTMEDAIRVVLSHANAYVQ